MSWEHFCDLHEIDESYRHCSEEDYKKINTNFFIEANKWYQVKKGTLLLHGETGTGKTHLSILLLKKEYLRWESFFKRKNIHMPVPVRFLHAKNIGEQYERHKGCSSFASLLGETEFLVIDDLGIRQRYPSDNEIFFGIFDKRFNKRKPTIVTSNLSISELAKDLHARTIDRMLAHELNMGGKSVRKIFT